MEKNATQNNAIHENDVNLSNVLSKIVVDDEFNHKLFEPFPKLQETETKSLIEAIEIYIEKSHHETNYYIGLLDLLSLIRPHHKNIIPQLLDCIKSFSNTKVEIEESLFPDLYNICYSEEKFNFEKFKILNILEEDNIEGFISLIAQNPKFDVKEDFEISFIGTYDTYIRHPEYTRFIKLIDFCCLFRSIQCFKYLLLNGCENTGKTCRWAIRGGCEEIIDLLVQQHKSFDNMLEESVKYHQYNLFNWLIANYKCEEIKLPKCLKNYNYTAFIYFLNEGADIHETCDEHQTLLHASCLIDHFPLIKYFVDKGLDINAKDKFKQTALHYASQNSHLDLVSYLIEHNADINAKNHYGKTALDSASMEGQLNIVSYLVEHNADINAKDDYGISALHYALENGQLNVVPYLIEHNADINAKDDYGNTALHYALLYALEKGHLNLVSYLIEHNADINAKNNDGWTALHIASMEGQLNIVSYLVEHNADINAKDKYGKTALHYASEKGYFDIVSYLIKHNANINAKNHYGKTALHYASDKGHLNIVSYLIGHNATS